MACCSNCCVSNCKCKANCTCATTPSCNCCSRCTGGQQCRCGENCGCGRCTPLTKCCSACEGRKCGCTGQQCPCEAASSRKVAAVVVLGDLERSPRMVNQALSLCECGWLVHLIGYTESKKLTWQSSFPIFNRLQVVPLRPQLRTMKHSKWIYSSTAFFVFLERFWLLFYQLCFFWKPRYSIIFVQNPPSIPTLIVAWFASKFIHRAKFLIDWHNFGYTLMQLSNAPIHLIKIAKGYERYFGRLADGNFCVCAAAQRFLLEEWRINSHLLYDLPTKRFLQSLTNDESCSLAKRLYASALTNRIDVNNSKGKETEMINERRPLVLISSTSWTPDENMDILLQVLVQLDTYLLQAANQITSETPSYRPIYMIITGKGPKREEFRRRLAELTFTCIVVDTLWLSWKEYIQTLAAANLGISLHYSSSGVDLPMKVVDMFACGVPVISYRYGCIDELVQHGKNGLLFNDADELYQHLCMLMTREGSEKLLKMRQYLRTHPLPSWDEEWQRIAKPMIESLTENVSTSD
eukprot:jgi/Galph1/4440/GphlegSOOS_G3100.1